MLSLTVGLDQKDIGALWRAKTLTGAIRNPSVWSAFRRTMTRAELSTPGGLYLGKRMVGGWDVEDEHAIIARHIRGLYFHHYRTPLLHETTFTVQRLRKLDDEMARSIRGFLPNIRSIAGGRFQYGYARVAGRNHHRSLWVLQFFNRYLVLATSNLEGYSGVSSEEG